MYKNVLVGFIGPSLLFVFLPRETKWQNQKHILMISDLIIICQYGNYTNSFYLLYYAPLYISTILQTYEILEETGKKYYDYFKKFDLWITVEGELTFKISQLNWFSWLSHYLGPRGIILDQARINL